MPRPPRWATILRTAVDEAKLAVRLYNDGTEARSFQGFVVHMHMAWLYLLHAQFERDTIDYRERDRNNPRRLVRVDGEPKRWGLSRCVEERWPDKQDPVRANLEFFTALRNRIEHRHVAAQEHLPAAVSGHAQAMLVNFEEELTANFGADWSLATQLRFPVFVGTFTTDGEEALRRLRQGLPVEMQRFIAEFHDGLTDEQTGDQRFELRLRVVLEQAKRDPTALAIQFTRWDDMTDDEKEVLAELGRRGQTVVREQARPVASYGLLRPAEATERVAAAVPYDFNSHHFLRARKRKDLRPESGVKHPKRTLKRYCVYDALSDSYGYTEAWVKWLIGKCSTAEGFHEATGREPRVKPKSD
jgi:hypothetical protein